MNINKLYGQLKSVVLSNNFSRNLWAYYRQKNLLDTYRKRRSKYTELASRNNLVYSEKSSIALIRSRLNKRSYFPEKKEIGKIHTFAFIPNIGWHNHLLPDLKELGPVSHFDYVALGFTWEEFYKADKNAWTRRNEMNDLAYHAVLKAHKNNPIDWIYVYANGREISVETIHKIVKEIGVPIVNMCLDDKQSWTGPWMGDHRAGQIDICSAFDISWTSAQVACEWYLAEGAIPFYMPEGFDVNSFKPISCQQDINVSFVGGAYGFRPSVISYLEKYNMPVQLYGKGWHNSQWENNIVSIYNRSKINLGMGGIGYSEELTNVKGRDFEVSAAGGGVYLTTYNPDLAKHFVIGEEILCYRNRDELIEMIQYYLANPDRAKEISKNARVRCLKEHRWLHRYKKICEILEILN